MASPPCTRFDPATLGRYLDRELTPSRHQAVANHMETCAACRNQVEMLKRIARRFSSHADHMVSDLDVRPSPLTDASASRSRPARFFNGSAGPWACGPY